MQKKGQILCDVKQEKVDFAKKAEKFHEIFNIESNGTPVIIVSQSNLIENGKPSRGVFIEGNNRMTALSAKDGLIVLLLVPLLEKRFDSDLVKKMQKDVTTRNQEINKLVEDGLLAPVPTSRNVLEPSCSTR
uniref:BESS domain-containing protein n=1 Tax=Caenorhabditis tropicalis TaxID=1561998 RepID=A0A1I7UU13_9PELO